VVFLNPISKVQVLPAMSDSKNETARVGEKAPEFSTSVVNPNGSISDIKDFVKSQNGKWSVLFFYPLDFTFVCPTEIIELSNHAAAFAKVNCNVYAGSVDSVFAHLAWTEMPRNKGGLGKMEMPLFSDLTQEIGKKYNCLMSSGHHSRATIIIDDKGVIVHISQNSPPVGRNVPEILRLVQGYQFAAEHGEVCPSTWTPGAKTIKPSPTDKLEFFATQK